MNTNAQTKLACVIGWPVVQSLSPRLHGHWLKEYGIDGSYVALPVQREDFSTAVQSLRREAYRGASVTVPHKEAAFAIAHRVDDAAKAAGAVNQLVFHEDDTIKGLNTDALGLAASLREAGLSLEGKPAILLGAGGAARAAVLALNELGAGEIRILNRDRHRAEVLVSNLSPSSNATLVPMELTDWRKIAGDTALAINTTSAGMKNTPSLDLALDHLPKDAAVCDIVYNPLETGLLNRARALNLKTIDGLGMLMHQAVPAFKAFFGVEPKVTPALRRELESALRNG
jgi:shikimate dehydrogenase